MNVNKSTDCVPSELKELIRIIVLNFYGFDFYVCIEYLMIYLCLREEDLAEMLKLDPKIVHEHLFTLKKDKFLNEKLTVDIQKDGKHIKHHLFYINYISAVNMIKYKIDKIRERIENEELKITESVYKCVNCSKVFTEFDLKEIFITMRCSRCYGEIREDIHQFRNLLPMFNTKMSRVFELLKKVDQINLPLSVLRPVAHSEHLIHRKPVLTDQINYVRKEDLKTKDLEILKSCEKKNFKNDKDNEENVFAKLLKYEFKQIKFNNDQFVFSLDKEADEKNFPTIIVNGKTIRFDKITPELTDEMNEREKEAYINVISDLYYQVYDNF
ncbi:general transcription factor IIE subunit 1-like [Brachionus plicatilis]|uniref:General transcription factor IIE subunit 1-like n=1 Tax=Brachionus plicatilis TaxID=10195 RepID=A0A3M7SUZ7_BRAPC|nr:general transcription factor IIE subunit 1-like [Brachionus plicatilis]